MRSCSVCGVDLPTTSQPTRLTCSGKCRQARSRQGRSGRRDLAFDLLFRQTRAVIDGDTTALRRIAAEAEAFFREARTA